MITIGSRVFDKADERHIGVVKQINRRDSGDTATIEWEKTGWLSYRVPLSDLRPAKKDT